jgi:hypothetical protein
MRLLMKQVGMELIAARRCLCARGAGLPSHEDPCHPRCLRLRPLYLPLTGDSDTKTHEQNMFTNGTCPGYETCSAIGRALAHALSRR